MIRTFLLLFIQVVFLNTYAQHDSPFFEQTIKLHTATGDIAGTLMLPTEGKMPVALLIAGSGPTDRNGNNSYMKNESLKMLAQALAKKGIASLRYDKRGIAESQAAGKSEATLRFDDYVSDAKEWISLLKKDNRFSSVTVIGHSEGSLIGMIAATAADKYVSIAGAGESADKILRRQLSEQPQQIKDMVYAMLDTLKKGDTLKDVSPMLYSLFRPSVQPYMISWMKYNPEAEIKKLKLPILILQGDNDLQVTTDDAKHLAQAAPKAQLVVIKNMNHILKTITGDKQENIKSYNDPALPISSELTNAITNFINK
jgi:uncharacterized protein